MKTLIMSSLLVSGICGYAIGQQREYIKLDRQYEAEDVVSMSRLLDCFEVRDTDGDDGKPYTKAIAISILKSCAEEWGQR